MDYLSDSDSQRLRKVWRQLDDFNPGQDYSHGLLEELFGNQSRSLKDSISLVSGAIRKRKSVAQGGAGRVRERIADIEIALQQFPFGTCYPHLEARRSHLERELDDLLHDFQEGEVSYWKDLQSLYKDLVYLVYKERNLDTVKKAVESP